MNRLLALIVFSLSLGCKEPNQMNTNQSQTNASVQLFNEAILGSSPTDAIPMLLTSPGADCAPHLQAKKLYARDKRCADTLMVECLQQLAADNGLAIDERSVTRIVNDQKTRRSAAYIAYGHWLVRRLAGESDGPAILALWRIIAWDPRGGMRRGFTLKLDDFRVAEQTLLSVIQDTK